MPIYRIRVENGVVRIYLEQAQPAFVGIVTEQGLVAVAGLLVSR
jgi:hypothetical protein